MIELASRDKDVGAMDAFLEELAVHPVRDEELGGALGRYLDIKARERGIPLHGTFELTPLCNLNCKMCYVHLGREQIDMKRMLSFDQWKALIDQAIHAGMFDVSLTGGECLTHPKFDGIYLYLQESGFRPAILTNGLLLTKDRIAFFKKHPPKGIQVTLYGSNDDEYEAVTGVRCFDIVMRNMGFLERSRIPFSVAITPNRYLCDRGESLIKLVHHRGWSYSINTALFTPRQETGRSETVQDLENDEYIRLHLLRRSLAGRQARLNHDCELPVPPAQGRAVKGLQCSAGNSGFFIGWDGKMLPCGSFDGIESYPLKMGFLQAWKEIHAACQEYPLPCECIECPYNHLCPACVMVHRQDSLPGHASPRVCDRAKKLVQNGLGNLV